MKSMWIQGIYDAAGLGQCSGGSMTQAVPAVDSMWDHVVINTTAVHRAGA